MVTFIKVQAASILGSIADYVTTIFLVEVLHCWYLVANLAGNIIGGSAQFILCRNWAFKVSGNKMKPQALKFILVFLGNLTLSAAGVYPLTHYLGINYIFPKQLYRSCWASVTTISCKSNLYLPDSSAS